jgi:hypothetical protein
VAKVVLNVIALVFERIEGFTQIERFSILDRKPPR